MSTPTVIVADRIRRWTDQDPTLVAAAKPIIVARAPSRPIGELGGYAVVFQASIVRWSIAGNKVSWRARTFDFPRAPRALQFVERELAIDDMAARLLNGTSAQVVVATCEPELATSGIDYAVPRRNSLRELATFKVSVGPNGRVLLS